MEPIATSSLELITAPMTAGEPRTFYLTGQYFELIDAVDPVDVVLSDMYGAQRGLMRQAEASFFLKSTAFKVVQITSATNQTIRFGYGSGEGGTRRSAGSVNIANQPTVTLDAAQLAQLLLLNRPQLPAVSWNSFATAVANTPITVFAAGANPNGAIVWTAEAGDALTGNSHQSFIAKATAPTTAFDGDIVALSVPANAGATVMHQLRLAQPTRIPAGLGLYFISSLAGAAGYARHCRYTLL